jgi:hypothetical protein
LLGSGEADEEGKRRKGENGKKKKRHNWARRFEWLSLTTFYPTLAKQKNGYP